MIIWKKQSVLSQYAKTKIEKTLVNFLKLKSTKYKKFAIHLYASVTY